MGPTPIQLNPVHRRGFFIHPRTHETFTLLLATHRLSHLPMSTVFGRLSSPRSARPPPPGSVAFIASEPPGTGISPAQRRRATYATAELTPQRKPSRKIRR